MNAPEMICFEDSWFDPRMFDAPKEFIVDDFQDTVPDIDRWAEQANRAHRIAETLGIRVAAGYLRNRGWTLDESLFFLCGAKVREGQ